MSPEQYEAFKRWLEQEIRHAQGRGWESERRTFQEVFDTIVATKHDWPSSATRKVWA